MKKGYHLLLENLYVKIVTTDLAAHDGGDNQMLNELFDAAAGISMEGSSLTSIKNLYKAIILLLQQSNRD